MTLDIRHDDKAHTFRAIVDGERCVLDYELDGSTMTITHTGVPEAVGGRGIAGKLTRFALATARTRGWKVIPDCSYAQQFFEKYDEYADLLA